MSPPPPPLGLLIFRSDWRHGLCAHLLLYASDGPSRSPPHDNIPSQLWNRNYTGLMFSLKGKGFHVRLATHPQDRGELGCWTQLRTGVGCKPSFTLALNMSLCLGHPLAHPSLTSLCVFVRTVYGTGLPTVTGEHTYFLLPYPKEEGDF